MQWISRSVLGIVGRAEHLTCRAAAVNVPYPLTVLILKSLFSCGCFIWCLTSDWGFPDTWYVFLLDVRSVDAHEHSLYIPEAKKKKKDWHAHMNWKGIVRYRMYDSRKYKIEVHHSSIQFHHAKFSFCNYCLSRPVQIESICRSSGKLFAPLLIPRLHMTAWLFLLQNMLHFLQSKLRDEVSAIICHFLDGVKPERPVCSSHIP